VLTEHHNAPTESTRTKFNHRSGRPLELSAQHRRDRARRRVKILQHAQAEIGDQKVAVAVARDPVRLAARLADAPNRVLVNEFCDG